MDEFWPSSESTVLSLNKKAMDKLKQNNHKEAFECLNEAEKLIKLHDLGNQMWAITMNNYGCYYKKTGKPQEALSCLHLALSKEKQLQNDSLNEAATHLNISSIYSSLSVHEKALQHGQKALKLLKNSPDRSMNAITTLVVAYHTVGLELEALYRQIEAMRMYKDGWELAKVSLNESHPLALSLKKSLFTAAKPTELTIPKRLSRISARKPKSSNTRLSYTKNPSYSPGQRDMFPYISEHGRNPSSSYAENYKKIKVLKGEEKNFPQQYVNTKPRKRITGINQKNIENLQNLIEEIEGSFKHKIKLEPKLFKEHKPSNNESQSSSIGIQVEVGEGISGKGKEKGSWRKFRKGKVGDQREIEFKKAEMRVRDALKEVEDLKNLKLMNEKKELMPVPTRSKVEFFRPGFLQTIYESRYEDQREAFVLIQSVVRMFIARRKYVKLKKASLRIQKHIRGYMTRKLFKNIITAVVFIQSFFRGHRVRKLYNFLLPN